MIPNNNRTTWSYEKFKGENTHRKFPNNLKSGGELLSKRIPLAKLGFLVSK
jgi:hypothetical protein